MLFHSFELFRADKELVPVEMLDMKEEAVAAVKGRVEAEGAEDLCAPPDREQVLDVVVI